MDMSEMKGKFTMGWILCECRDLWQWLADNPKDTKKEDWPGWDKYESENGWSDIENDCFACEWVTQEYGCIGDEGEGDNCLTCPLVDLWGKDGMDEVEEGEYNESHYCENSLTSAYRLWRRCKTPRQKKVHAKKIAKFCQDAIDRL
jgi:hypothetical protein